MADPYTISDIVEELVRTQAPVPWDGASRPLRTREEVHEWLATQGINSMDSREMLEPIYPEGAYENLSPMARPELTATSGPPAAALSRSQYAQPEPSLFGMDLPGRTMSDLSDVTAQSVQQRAADIGRTIGAPAVRAASEVGGQFLGAFEAQRPELERAERIRRIRRPPTAVGPGPMYQDQPVPQSPQQVDPRTREQDISLTQQFLDRAPAGPARDIAGEHEELLMQQRPGTLSRVADKAARAGADVAFDAFGLQPPSAAQQMGRTARASLGEDIAEGALGAVDVGVSLTGLAAGAVGSAVEAAGEATGLADVGRKMVATMGGGLPMASSRSEPAYKGLSEAYANMQSIQEERFDRDTVDNLRTDISDIMSVIPVLGSMIFDVPGDADKLGFPERLGPLLRNKASTGLVIGDSALAGMAYIVANPWDSLHTMPVSTLLTLLDVGVAVKGMKGAATLDPRVLAAIEKVEAKAAQYLMEHPKVAEAIDFVPDIKRRAGAAVQRALGDPTANVDPVSHLMLDETLRGSRQQGAAARTQLEGIARTIEEGETGSAPFGTGSSFKRGFEEFDKTINPATGKIEQPVSSSRDRAAAPSKRARVRKGDIPVGQKGGSRVRTGKVERVTFDGMTRTVRDELVDFFQPGGSDRTVIKSKHLDDAISEGVSFAVPNQVMMSKTARTQALEDAKAWVTNPNKANGRPKRMEDWIDPVHEKAKLEAFLKGAKQEIAAMASRSVPKGITGSSNVYNLRLRLGDEVFSVLDDSVMLLKEAGDMKNIVRAESVRALANRMSETAEQVRRQNVWSKSLDDYAPTYVTETRMVRKGDTIKSIARDNNVSPERLRKGGATYRGQPLDWDNLDKYTGLNIDGVQARYRSLRKNGGQITFTANATPAAAFSRITKSLEDTGSLPSAMRVSPENPTLLAMIDEASGPIGGVPKWRVKRDLGRYKAINRGDDGHGVLGELGVIDEVAQGKTRRVAKRPVVMPENAIWVNPGAYSTLKWWAKDRATLRGISGWDKTMRWMKSNLTARNPTTHMNNIIANATIQGIRRGEPLTMSQVMKVGIEYRDFLKGNLKDPKKKEMYRAIERTGGLKSDMVASELKALAAGKEVAETGLSPHKALERVYAWEDNVFKLEEAARNYRYMDGVLDDLSEGQWIDADLTKGKRGRLTKTSRGWQLQMYNKRGRLGKSHGVRPSQVRDVIAQASMKPALDLFFDYRDVSQIASGLRSSLKGATGAVGAPFFTWFSKAMTIPFVQKGIMGEMLSGRPMLRSNSQKVLSNQLADAVAGSARRSFVINTTRQEMIDNQELVAGLASHHKGVLKRLPAVLRPVVESFNPLYFEMRNLEYMSPSQPADTLLRVMYHGLGTFHLPALLEGLDPWSDASFSDAFFTTGEAPEATLERLLEKESPEESQRQKTLKSIWQRHPGIMNGLPAEDFFTLLGASGGLLADLPRLMGDGDWSGIRDTFVSLIVPAVYVKGADAAYSATWKYAMDKKTQADWPMHATGRERTHGDKFSAPKSMGHAPYAKQTDEFQRWAIRSLLGLGTKPVMVGDEMRNYIELGAKGQSVDDVVRKSPLRKLYDQAAEKLSASYLKEPKRRMGNLALQYRDAEDGEKGRILNLLTREARDIEKVAGTQTAKRLWKEYFKRAPKFIPMDTKPVDGLLREEIKRNYDWIVEPFKKSLQLGRKLTKQELKEARGETPAKPQPSADIIEDGLNAEDEE